MYAIFNIAIDCDIALPELVEVEIADIVINVRKGEKKENTSEQPIWFHQWTEPCSPISIFSNKQENTYLLRFPDLIDFIISPSGEWIKYFPKSCLAIETIRHLLLDQVIPRILGHRGELILHASAVEITNNVSIAFIGESGAGKSTLASSFHKSGTKLITDDCLLLDKQDGKIVGIPNYDGVRLYGDSAEAVLGRQQSDLPVAHYSTKNRFHFTSQSPQRENIQFPLEALFLITDSAENIENNDIVISPIKGAEKLMFILKQTFVLDVTDQASIKRQFKNMSHLTSSHIRIFHLQYPRKYELLPIVLEQIKDIL